MPEKNNLTIDQVMRNKQPWEVALVEPPCYFFPIEHVSADKWLGLLLIVEPNALKYGTAEQSGQLVFSYIETKIDMPNFGDVKKIYYGMIEEENACLQVMQQR